MHETGIATGLLQLIREELSRRGNLRCLAARVEVGELSGVSPEALSFAFEHLAPSHGLAGTRLTIVPVPGRVKCGACGQEGDFPRETWRCLHCQGGPLEVLQGKEMDLRELEVEEK